MSFRILVTHNIGEVLAGLRRAPVEVLAELDRALARGAVEIAREARERAPKSTSELTNRIQPGRIGPLVHEVRAASDYASYREEGTGPGGRPSLQRTLAWLRRAGIQPRDPAMSLRSLAHLVRRKIARDGTPAQPFMRPALEAKRSRLRELAVAGVQRGLSRIEGGRR